MTDDKTEYRDESHINVASDVDQSKVPSTVKKLATWIRQKMYGEDVRESIARGIEKSSEVAQSAVDTANDTASRQDEVDQSQKDFEDRYNDQIAGNTDLDEVIDSRKPAGKPSYKTLGERLNLEHNSNLIDENLISGGYVKDYFEPEIRRVKSELKDGLFTFGQMNDTHWEQITRHRKNANLSLNHVKNLLAFSDVADLLLLNGDNTNSDNYSLDEVKKDVETITDVFFDEDIDGSADRFVQLGNHDDGSTRREYATPYRFLAQDDYLHDDYFQKMFRTSANQGEVRYYTNLFFYKDYPEKHIRFVCLNTSDILENQLDSNGSQKYDRWGTHVIRQEQMNWIANTALKNIPEGSHVVIVGHCPPNVNNVGGITDTGGKYFNFDVLLGILDAFKNGTTYTGTSSNHDFRVSVSCDYTAQGPKPLVGYFSGHTHRDATSVLDGINIIEINRSFATDSLVGTAKEDAFAIVQVDTVNRKAIINGFGSCADREVSY